MLETKQQKRYFVTSVALILVLAIVSSCTKTDFRYQNRGGSQGGLSAEQQEAALKKAYADYVKSIKTDPQATKQLFQELYSEQELRTMVRGELKADQPIVVPEVPDTSIKVTSTSGQQAVVDYLTGSLTAVASLNERLKAVGQDLTGGSAAAVKAELTKATEQLRGVPVPKEAAGLQKALLASYASYERLADASEASAAGLGPDPWPEAYRHYGVLDQTAQRYTDELAKLDQKYKLSDLGPLKIAVRSAEPSASGLPFVKTANALFGIADFSFTTIVVDIPKLIFDAIKVALVNAFTRFIVSMLQKIIDKIERNYRISNFLYYTDALISGQYSDDYLKKYVRDEIDREVIKKFMPQFSCNQSNAALQPIIKQKAVAHLGFDPSGLDPTSPDYLVKLSRVGNFLAQPTGWETYFQDAAAQTQSEAETAADRELKSQGFKSPRDVTQLLIGKSLSSIESSLKASLNNLLNIGTAATSGTGFKGLVTSLITSITQTFLLNFIFKGATGGNLSVLKEQATCVAALQFNLVVPAGEEMFVEPQVDEEAIRQQECARYPRGCDTTGGVGTAPPTGVQCPFATLQECLDAYGGQAAICASVGCQ